MQFNRPDNYLSFNANTCEMHAEGKMNFDIRPQETKIEYYGSVDAKEGEADFKEIWSEPLPDVVSVLNKYETYKEVSENLPDIEIIKS